MNLRRFFVLPLAAAAAFQSLAMAQQPADPASALLPVNYRVTLIHRDGEKTLGELSTLTCSPNVMVDGTLDASGILVAGSRIPIIGFVRGTMRDENGVIVFAYTVGMQMPVPTQVVSTPAAGATTATIQYKDVRCTGTLHMKPGKSYEVFQTGGRTFSLCVTPESDK